MRKFLPLHRGVQYLPLTCTEAFCTSFWLAQSILCPVPPFILKRCFCWLGSHRYPACFGSHPHAVSPRKLGFVKRFDFEWVKNSIELEHCSRLSQVTLSSQADKSSLIIYCSRPPFVQQRRSSFPSREEFWLISQTDQDILISPQMLWRSHDYSVWFWLNQVSSYDNQSMVFFTQIRLTKNPLQNQQAPCCSARPLSSYTGVEDKYL